MGGSKVPPVLFIPVMYGQMYSAYDIRCYMTFHIVQEASNVRRYRYVVRRLGLGGRLGLGDRLNTQLTNNWSVRAQSVALRATLGHTLS